MALILFLKKKNTKEALLLKKNILAKKALFGYNKIYFK